MFPKETSVHIFYEVVTGKNLTLLEKKKKRASFSHAKSLALIQWFCSIIYSNRNFCLLAYLSQLLKHLFTEQKKGQWKANSFNETMSSEEHSEMGRKHEWSFHHESSESGKKWA